MIFVFEFETRSARSETELLDKKREGNLIVRILSGYIFGWAEHQDKGTFGLE